MDIRVFLNCGTIPGVPLAFQGETNLLLRCNGNVGIPLQTKQGKDPHLEMRREKRVCSSVLLGYSVFLWSADGYIRELLEFIKGVKYLFEAQEGR